MVLVHVIAFKGICSGKAALSWWTSLCGMLQGREGYSLTLYRNYLLPISSNKEQDEKDAPVQELKTPTPQLQCHLWIVGLLMKGCLGWSHQAQQVTHPRVVWINLLCLDMVCKQPGSNCHGGTRILVCWQIPLCLASWMHWLVCVPVSMLYPVCTPFSGEVQCEYTLLIPPHVC